MKSLIAVLVVGILIPLALGSEGDADGVRFFEQRIRPVLVEHCYGCHSSAARDAKKLQGSLYLDSAAGVANGGESGAAIVKGKANESLLIKALKHDEIEMPPSGKLSDEIVADFAKWIDLGAPDPRIGEAPEKPKRDISIEDGKTWWSFQPLKTVALPDANRPIDGFVEQAQRQRGLTRIHPATRNALLRRAYFDLIGLPPTPERIAAFVDDPSPDAFEKVVDELLASPAYGERWARHWLDAARFAESGGYEFDGFRPGAYHYRDWVIRAFNADLPYDQFVRMQLAGDIIAPNEIDGAASTGFLVAGPYPGQITAKTVERIRYDQIDDMMMTMGGAMLGLTLGCVRCHEHKYDPIPHQDYYAVAASLARTVHGSRSFDTDPVATERKLQEHADQHAPLVAALENFAIKELPVRFEKWRQRELKKLPEPTRWQVLAPVALHAERSYLKELPNSIIAHDGLVNAEISVRTRGQRRAIGNDEKYRLEFQTLQKNVQSLRMDAFADKSLPQRGPGLNADGSFQLTDLKVMARPLDPQSKESPVDVKLIPVFAAFEDKDQSLANAVDNKPATAWVVKTTAKKDNAAILEFDPPLLGFAGGTELTIELTFRDLGLGRMRWSISVDPNPATWAGDVASQRESELRAAAELKSELPNHICVPLARWFAPFDSDVDQLVRAVREHASSAPRPNITEVYTTIAGGQDVFYLRRGEVDNKQSKAEPGFLQVLWRGDNSPKPPEKSTEDPRMSMANWITDTNYGAGPLLARVVVNRIWQHHFGEGIVSTPNDFGSQGSRPTHPELLEFLASELIRNGWKIKPLHKLIVLSDVYRQSHEGDPGNRTIDPGNQYLWQFRTRRLEAETIRDALLAVGENLDASMYGKSVLDDSLRRSVYLRVKRSELLPVMTMFDAPEPTQSIGQRSVTTVPTQALAMMNSDMVRRQAERFYDRIKPVTDSSLPAAVERSYHIAFGRKPSTEEQRDMISFIEQQKMLRASNAAEALDGAMVEFCHVLLCLNEFIYVD